MLGSGGISVIRKIFGVVLMAIAVKLFATHVGGLIQ
jgi:multiple antibiotic resistance protein